jgi:uncharacterized protein (DUF488 family)
MIIKHNQNSSHQAGKKYEWSMELCRQLAKESLNKNITLLCFEDDEHLCHRSLVRKICEQMKK